MLTAKQRILDRSNVATSSSFVTDRPALPPSPGESFFTLATYYFCTLISSFVFLLPTLSSETLQGGSFTLEQLLFNFNGFHI
ncbi:hypothetical protein DENSPDRAFT_547627 [Dentipellis sp. KUC8613]|nr:hypothetical protein DENSPDRAFT_547627 [Dentipellis sp. KUC8613]